MLAWSTSTRSVSEMKVIAPARVPPPITLADVPVNVMDQYHPDTFCDPRSQKYRPQYAELARRCTAQEIRSAYHHARERGLYFEGITFEREPLEC